MSNIALRRRLAKAGEQRRLTDGQAEAILAAEKSIDAPIQWKPHNRTWFRMTVEVSNRLGERLKMTGNVSRDYPGRSSWTLTWGDKTAGEFPEAIRRLDLRGKHLGNADGSIWDYETHKHRWSQADGDREAYTPTDIPHDQPGSAITRDDYKVIFEAFAAECDIGLGPTYDWSGPRLECDDMTTDGLWDV